jgi:hypothetical protein
MSYIWTGTRRDGVSVSGKTETMHNLAGFVRHKFRRGWRSLAISHNGEVVGGIGPHKDTGRRSWWPAKRKGGTA